MPAPINKYVASLVALDGSPFDSPKWFVTRNAAIVGAREMIRLAPQGFSVYIYDVAGHIDMTVTYDLVADTP